jgi:hypothetical protein
MKSFAPIIISFVLLLALPAMSELSVPGFTSYTDLDPHTGNPVSDSPLLKIFWE